MQLIKRTILKNSHPTEYTVRFTNKNFFAYFNKALMQKISYKTMFLAYSEDKKIMLKFAGYEDTPSYDYHLRRLSITKTRARLKGGANCAMKDIIVTMNIEDGTYRAEIDETGNIVTVDLTDKIGN